MLPNEAKYSHLTKEQPRRLAPKMASLIRKKCFKLIHGGICVQQSRMLNVHEHVGLEILRDNGIRVPRFGVAENAEDAVKIASKELEGVSDFVVKAQVLAGGRGKGKFESGLKGGVKKVFSTDELRDVAAKMIGNKLITKQTGDKGVPCNAVLVVEMLYPRREYYVAFTLEREFGVIPSFENSCHISIITHLPKGSCSHCIKSRWDGH